MIGVDLIKIDRMERLIEKYGDKALTRFLHESEIALVKKPRNAAGFWAAKEACAKALGTGIGKVCGFHDITLSKSELGAPQLYLSNRVKVAFHIIDTSVSITHDGEYAVAVVALEKDKQRS